MLQEGEGRAQEEMRGVREGKRREGGRKEMKGMYRPMSQEREGRR